MATDRVDDVFLRSRFEGFRVGVGQGGERALGGVVAGEEGGVVGSAVVPGAATAAEVKVVDCVGLDAVLAGGMAGTVGCVFLLG